jgi:hypothetical protein
MFIELQYVPACLLATTGGLRVLWVPSSAITRNMAVQATVSSQYSITTCSTIERNQGISELVGRAPLRTNLVITSEAGLVYRTSYLLRSQTDASTTN